MAEDLATKELLKGISLFNNLEDSDREKIAQVVQKGNIPAGTTFFKEGEAGDAFYVLVSGEVEVLKNDGNSQKVLATIKSSDENNFFGEMALVEDLPRNATIVAKTECSILEIEKKNFDMLLRVNSFVALRVMTALTKRLRAVSLPTSTGSEQKPVSAKIVTFFSPKGGSGKTTVATNFAAGLSKYLNKKVLIINLDLQFGDIAFMLKLKVGKTIYDVTTDGSLKSFDSLKTAFLKHELGFYLLSSPRRPEESESVDSNHLRKIIALCKDQFDYIVIDTHSLLHDLTINALDLSDYIMLIMNPDAGHALAIRNCLNVMENLKYPKEKINVILNRSNIANGIPKEDIDSFLKKQNACINYIVHDDWKVCSNLINDGKIVFADSENCEYRSDIVNLIAGVSGEKMPEEAGTSGNKGILSSLKNWLNS